MPKPAILTLDDVTKAHDDQVLLAGASIVVDEGTRIGVVGANGCGKSTLLRVLAGIEPVDSGRRTVRAGLRIGHLAQDVPLHAGTVRDAVRAGLAGRDEVVARIDSIHHELSEPGLAPSRTESLLAELGHLESRRDHLGGHDIEHRVEEMIAHVGLPSPDASAAALSGGEQRRVSLARILLDEPDVLLLDEPTNHLDAFVIDWLEDRLLEMRVPLVLVTHDRYFLDRIVDDVVEIERGVLHASTGGYSGYVAARAAREAAAEHSETVRRSLLRRETEWMRRGPPARTTKADARIRRYHQLLDAAPPAAAGELDIRIPPGPRLGDVVMRLRGVTLRVGDRTLVRDFDLDVGRGTRLGIVGPNGAGKTTLLRALTGAREPDAGTVERGETVRVAGIDQLRTDIDPESTVVEAVTADGEHVRVGGRAVRVESFLDQFLFPGERKHTQVKRLSGGERNRILLAKLLLRGANVLVLDEPTNDLDLPTLRALEEALLAFDGTVIAVSHDRWFLDRVATEIVHLDGLGNARRWAGDVSSLLERAASERAAEEKRAREAAARAAAPVATQAPRARKLASRDEKELAELPARIEVAEKRQHELTAQMSDPALYTSPARAAERTRIEAELATTVAEVERLYARWTELEEKRTAGS